MKCVKCNREILSGEEAVVAIALLRSGEEETQVFCTACLSPPEIIEEQE
jgi:hypothetical protein